MAHQGEGVTGTSGAHKTRKGLKKKVFKTEDVSQRRTKNIFNRLYDRYKAGGEGSPELKEFFDSTRFSKDGLPANFSIGDPIMRKLLQSGVALSADVRANLEKLYPGLARGKKQDDGGGNRDFTSGGGNRDDGFRDSGGGSRTSFDNTSRPDITTTRTSAEQTRTAANDARRDALYDTLRNRMNQSLELDPNDPIIRNQVDAYSAQGTKARRDFISDQAERSNPYSTGFMQGQRRMTAESLGKNVGSFQAQLMQRELTSRRQEIAQALTQTGQLLTSDQRDVLSRELSQLDATIKRYGIDVSKYGINVGADTARFGITTGANTARYGIDVGAQTSADRLGFDIGDRENWWFNEAQRRAAGL